LNLQTFFDFFFAGWLFRHPAAGLFLAGERKLFFEHRSKNQFPLRPPQRQRAASHRRFSPPNIPSFAGLTGESLNSCFSDIIDN